MATQTPLLDRLAEMQNRPFGTNTALSDGSQYGVGGSAGSQFRRQASAYGQALRILNRAARRGDANAALRAISVREDAMNKGYSPGGVSRKAEADAGILGRLDAMRSSAADRQRAAELERARAEIELGQGQGQGQGLMGGTPAPAPATAPTTSFMGGTALEGATGVEGAKGLYADVKPTVGGGATRKGKSLLSRFLERTARY